MYLTNFTKFIFIVFISVENDHSSGENDHDQDDGDDCDDNETDFVKNNNEMN